MTADAIFVQGHGHTICQDHAVTITDPFLSNYGMAIVCDGCSASPKSEVGAALLPHLFMSAYNDLRFGHLKQDPSAEKIFDTLLTLSIQDKIREVLRLAWLKDNAFDATIIAAVSDEEKGLLRLFMWGDGHILIENEEGQTHYSAHYASGAPKYLSYLLDPERNDMYKAAFGGAAKILTTRKTGVDGLEKTESCDFPDYHCWTLPLKGVSRVQVFSDGLDSFTDAEGKPVLTRDILKEVSRFKLSHGNFVQRRVRRALKEYQKVGITHFDDFSSAAISFEDTTLARGK